MNIYNQLFKKMEDVARRIRCGWTMWRKATVVFCDKKVKGKFYRSVVKPAMMHRRAKC